MSGIDPILTGLGFYIVVVTNDGVPLQIPVFKLDPILRLIFAIAL